MRGTGGEEAPEPAPVRIPTPLSAAMTPRARRTAAGPNTRRLRRYAAFVAGAQTVRAMDQPAEERALFLLGIGLAALSRARHGSQPRLSGRKPARVRPHSAKPARPAGSAPRPMRLLKGRPMPLLLGAVGAATLVRWAQEFLVFGLVDEAYERWRLRHRGAAGRG